MTPTSSDTHSKNQSFRRGKGRQWTTGSCGRRDPGAIATLGLRGLTVGTLEPGRDGRAPDVLGARSLLKPTPRVLEIRASGGHRTRVESAKPCRAVCLQSDRRFFSPHRCGGRRRGEGPVFLQCSGSRFARSSDCGGVYGRLGFTTALAALVFLPRDQLSRA
jgi:hypothetical protein